MRRIPALLAVLLAVLALAVPAQAATGITATFSRTGTSAKFVVANASTTALNGWSIKFDLPAGVTASAPQNATITQNGTRVTLTPAFYINNLPPGRNTEPYSPTFSLSTAADPTTCTINNMACDGSGTAPPAPTGLTAEYSVAGGAAKFVVRNHSAVAVSDWSISFTLPNGVTVSNGQNGTISQNGNQVTVAPAHYNKTINAGGTTEPYSPAFSISQNVDPVTCRINNANCDGSADTPPSAPTGLAAPTKTTRTVSLQWNVSTPGSLPVAGYDVYNGSSLAGSSTTTSTIITGLSPNTAYSFTVRAKDTKGTQSAPSSALSVTTNNPANDTTPPTAPGNLRSTAKDAGSITLAWNASTDNSGIANYDVYVGTTVKTTVSGTTAVVSGLSPSTNYTFTVKARDLYDNVSAASNALNERTGDIVGGYARVGYFVQWGIYGRQYFVKDMDAAKMTHVNYAFGNIDPVNLTCLHGVTKGTSPNPQDPNQGDGAGDAEADYSRPMSAAQSVDGVADSGWEPLRGNYNQLKKLKAKHPNLKVLISLGGWTYSKYFSDVAATDAARKKFVASCLDVYIKGNLPVYNGAGGPGSAAGIFDGIDLDWEWPGAEGHAGNHFGPQDKVNNTLLIEEFRRQMDALSTTTGKRYQLTAFTPADPAKIEAGWELGRVAQSMDIFNVQGYDFHGSGSDNSWEPNRTGHQGNLYPDPDDPYTTKFSVESTVQAYLDAGVPSRKITLGLAFYGRGWQNVVNGGKNGEWQTAGGAAPGQFPEESGTRGYANLVASVPNCTVFHDEVAVATSCYTGNQWWTFDDVWSIQKKTAWLKSKNLLGAMFWEMSGDRGPLMAAVDAGLR
ncbi:glycosyl hydrolase family 18 protein [Lentzea sp. BCCO 10_0798]|uniref:chitinase n=1 Tax=Lentzea kristufekii TaxID=3095430 RepID=A0ABU4TLB6_9PSEU|nr:glycosyl hydrolase family 18 protein [Lentzea sp. BCCO 10_0798]MDX8049083.1 glycosyl hydrolase family 18 protein [Lentzea sp. BCCO 10_0798]